SLAMRLAAALNLAGEYEVNRNLSAGGRGGGVDDKPIPNHVYRWTLREVEKLVRSLDPAHKPRIRARREWSIQEHVRRLLSRALPGGSDRQWPSRVGKLASDSFNTLAGSHGNSLAVQIEKTYELQPWIEQDGDGLKLTSDPSRARRRSGLASRLPIYIRATRCSSPDAYLSNLERKRHPRNLRRGRRPSSSAAPLIASGEAFASTGAEPPWNRGAYGPRPWRGSAAGAVNVRGYLSTGAQRPFPLRIGPRGWGEAKTRDRRASWSVQIPAMGPDPSGAPTGGGARPPRSELLARLWPPHIASRAA